MSSKNNMFKGMVFFKLNIILDFDSNDSTSDSESE